MSENRLLDTADLHSHLVPDVDDGSRNLDDVLEGVGRMATRGILRIVTTPHIDGSLTHRKEALEARLSQVDQAFETARAAAVAAHPGLRFGRGHEIMLDHPDPDVSDPRLRLDGGEWVLVEWPRLQIPPQTSRTLRRLREQGVRVLIAHPERYQGYDAALSHLDDWKAEGAGLQVNFASVLGRYGVDARDRAFRMLEEGYVDCLASDFHGRPHLRLYLGEAEGLFRELGAEEIWNTLTRTNPHRILDGEIPLPVQPIQPRRGLWRRLLGAFRR